MPEQPVTPERRWAWWSLIGLSTLIAGLYAYTTSARILFEDDGYFVMAGYFAGFGHPPGYPLFSALLHGFIQIPLGSVAWRAHLASGCLGALTCLLTGILIRHLTRSTGAALCGAALLAIAPVFWSQSQIADVYTLNTALLLLLFCLCAALYRWPHRARTLLHGAALVTGLSLSNHWPLTVLAGPGLLCGFWPWRRHIARHLPTLLVTLALGLLPYAWMVYRSHDPSLPFLFIGSINSIEEFLAYLLRDYYAVDQSPTATVQDKVLFIRFLGASWAAQFTVVGLVIALAGVVVSLRRQSRALATGLLVTGLILPAALLLRLNFDYDAIWTHVFRVYPLPSYTITAIWLGVGLHAIQQRTGIPAARFYGGSAVAILALLVYRFPQHNLHDFRETREYAEALLTPLADHAVLVTEGDTNTAVLGYYHLVEGLRPDIALITRDGTLFNHPLLPLKLPRAAIDRRLQTLVRQGERPVLFTRPYKKLQNRVWHDRGLTGVMSPAHATHPGLLDTHTRYLQSLYHRRYDSRYFWQQHHQNTLRYRYCYLSGRWPRLPDTLPRAACQQYFQGRLGWLEGRVASNPPMEPRQILQLAEQAIRSMPARPVKKDLARLLNLQSVAWLKLGQADHASQLARKSLSVYPLKRNQAHELLEKARELARRQGKTRG